MLSDLPSLIIGPLIFCSISYWLIGFQADIFKFLLYIAIVIVFVTTMTSMFVFVGCLAPNPQVGQIIASLMTGIKREREGRRWRERKMSEREFCFVLILTFLSVIFFLFAGFYVAADTIPQYYIWLK